jgi:hypothetical protein
MKSRKEKLLFAIFGIGPKPIHYANERRRKR